MSHRQLAQTRPQGRSLVRVYTPTVEEHGWSSGHTVVEVVTDDMPFLVDSVTMALTRRDRAIHLVVHPQFVVRRDIAGRAARGLRRRGVRPRGRRDAGRSCRVLDAHRDRPRDRPRRSRTDHRRASQRAARRPRGRRGLAADAASGARRSPPSWRRTSCRFRPRRWPRRRSCCAGWPTTTSPSSATASTCSTPSTARTAPRGDRHPGLGILRADQELSGSFAKLLASGQARAREKRVLVLTKANSRSTVHRTTYLDYVGVKIFDENGEVVGERRFLGLFTSAAYTESVHAHPGAAPQGAAGARAQRLRSERPLGQGPACRCSRPIPATSCSRSRSTSCCPTALAVAAPAGAAPAAAVRPPRRLRPVYVLPGLPAAGPLQHDGARADPEHPARATRRRDDRLHCPGQRGRCWRGCTSSSGCAPDQALPDARRRRRSRDSSPRPPGHGATTSPTPWRSRSARSRRPDSLRRYARRVPRGIQGGLPGPDRGGGPAPAGGAPDDERPGHEPLPAGRCGPRTSGGSRSTGPGHRSRCPRCCRSCREWASRSSTNGPTRSSGTATPRCARLDLRLRPALPRLVR